MAENAVVKEQLTDAMIEAGAELTSKLDDSWASCCGSVLVISAGSERVAIADRSQEVSSSGPYVYEKIRRTVEELGDRSAQCHFRFISVLDAERIWYAA